MLLNRYPRWKNVLVVVLLLVGFVYALPNMFGEEPAVQISALKQGRIDAAFQTRVEHALKAADIPYRITVHPDNVLLRFKSTNTQLKAKDLLESTLGRDYMVALNLAPAVPNAFRFIGASPMKLGLDLRGGVHFLLQVDMPAAQKRHLESMAEMLRTRLREEKIRYRTIGVQQLALNLRFQSAETQAQALKLMKQEFPGLVTTLTQDGESYFIHANLSEQQEKEMRDYAIDQSMTTLRNRVNELGVAEAIVQRQGAERIVVELPGVQDTAHAKEILGKTASLNFYIVNHEHDARQYMNSKPPAGTVLYYDREGRPTLFDRKVVLSGESIVSAQSGIDEYGKAEVNITLGGNTRYFSKITGENIQNQMGTVFIETHFEDMDVDGEVKRVSKTTYEVISVATIQSRLGNRFRISNMSSPQEARNLALLLRAGALPAPIDIVEERIIGPSLGMENITMGMISLGVGLALVLLFMMGYYRFFGLLADIALLMNLVLLVAVLSIIGATLTLPGIAGIVLTMGMAVDANVLIFERIREELRNGSTVQASISAGFDKAFITIVDAQLTTFIAALALFSIGSGPIKGFAITLIIGLLTSVFTAVTVSRAMVNALFGGKTLKRLSIGI